MVKNEGDASGWSRRSKAAAAVASTFDQHGRISVEAVLKSGAPLAAVALVKDAGREL